MLSRPVGDTDVFQRLYARLRPIGDFVPGRRFLVPGTCRSGRVLVEGGEVYVELAAVEGAEPERRLLRSHVLVLPIPEPPAAEHAP